MYKRGVTMAEFCLECWNRLNGTNHSKRKYIISKDLDLCEGCGEWKPVIIIERKMYYRRLFAPVIIILRALIRLPALPFFIIWYTKKHKK